MAAGLLVALAGMVGWWFVNGGWHGRLVEFEDRDAPLSSRFQVDINAADWPELTQLPGVGPALAHRIVESRQTFGPFRDQNDLRRVRGIGPNVLEQIRPYLLPMPDRSNLNAAESPISVTDSGTLN